MEVDYPTRPNRSINMASKHVGTSVEGDKASVAAAAKISNVLTEGTAKMQFEEGEQVFYNPVQVLNRDVSIQCITLFSKIIQVPTFNFIIEIAERIFVSCKSNHSSFGMCSYRKKKLQSSVEN